MKTSQPVSFLASLMTCLVYVLFTFIAFSQFPGAYSPSNNWLSDLGSIDLNPKGAVFYNTGIILTGILLGLFFLGLSKWKIPASRVQNVMVEVTRWFGLLGCFAMVMSAIYPINHVAEHHVLSISLYILLGTAFMFSVFAFRYHPTLPRWILVFGVVTAMVDIASGIFQSFYWLEWVTVAFFLGYAITIGIQTKGVQAKIAPTASV
jgi:hypothetical membrane protein